MTFSKIIPKALLFSIFTISALTVSCQDKDISAVESSNTVQEATLEQKKQALQNFVPSSNTTQSVGGAINPPHGQPGHRCEIPVGAPLNGNTAAPKVTPVQNKSIGGNNQPKATPVVAEGINPPHGQPGHRCDIKVGDPLY